MPGTVEGKTGAAPLSVGDCTLMSWLAQQNMGCAKLAARGTLLHETKRSNCESLPLLFVSSSGFPNPKQSPDPSCTSTVVMFKERGVFLRPTVPVLNTLDFHFVPRL